MRNILAMLLVFGFFMILVPATARGSDITVAFVDSGETLQDLFFGFNLNSCVRETCVVPVSVGGSYTNPSAINMTFNIYDQDGVTLNDTLAITGAAGSNFITSTFVSDTEGVPLLPLPGGSDTGAASCDDRDFPL